MIFVELLEQEQLNFDVFSFSLRTKPVCMLSRTHTVNGHQSADISFSCSCIYSSLMVLLVLTRPTCVRRFCFELDSWKMAGDFLQAFGRDLMENVLKLVRDSWNELSKARKGKKKKKINEQIWAVMKKAFDAGIFFISSEGNSSKQKQLISVKC